MATIAMVTEILSQTPIMATLALKWHMDGCRGDEKRYPKISVTMETKMLP